MINVKELERELEHLSKNYSDVWKAKNIDDDEKYCRGESYLSEKVK